MTIEKAIKAHLRALHAGGRTLAEIAEMLEVSAATVHCYIKDTQRIPPKKCAAIVERLGIEIEETPENALMEQDAEPAEKQAVSMSTREAARLLGKSKRFVEQGLQQGRFPWGWAVLMKRWEYWISPVKFTEYTGIEPLGGDS